ncbi:MAG TPA: branched-chain amino acid ABC transporter substrate-binding protein, partial [Candidatus Acidoferrum sp.]|nr:branched-chain amino acid ABC transporter substrate-binding protein [Candidatus Acidoferrum sp.]
MRKATVSILVLIGLMVFAILVAMPDASQAGTKEFKIGVMAPMTGDLARWGLDHLHATELAAEEINAKGGVLGAKVIVIGEDDQHNPKLGEAVAQKFVDDKDVMGVIGPYNSAVTLAVTPIFEKVGLIHMGASTSNPKLTEQGYKTVFRVCSRDDRQGPAGAEYVLKTLKAKKVAVLDDQTTFGKGVADEFVKKVEAEGVKPTRAVIKAGDKDFRAVLGTIPKDTAAIYYGGYAPEAALLVRQLKELGHKAVFVGPDGLFEPEDYIKAAGGTAEGSIVTALAAPPESVPAAKDFIKKYEAKYGTIGPYSLNVYDGVNIIFAAIKRAGKFDRKAISAEVAKTKNYKGISSGHMITFNEKGDNVNASV